ncbi:glycine betaine ABC transporter substrate-binding protein [Kushneria aurantia]|uniref:Glycine betaine ABC transporter substrate-binding protein n=1 Tax=Kushneria aurantia TaxID=504092 RepID=A0ABV6G555_9GAMM|nr:glycine betaine ABC transporter substrate-binding protein [Kushneria aurantia]
MTFSISAKRHSLTRAVAMGAALTAGLGVSAAATAEQNQGSISLAYVEWSDAVASTNVVRSVLEDAGYDVSTSSLSAAAMWQAIATGDADAMVAAWLPTTHESYYERLKDQVVDLGPNFEGTKLGLVVPDYVTDVTSIGDLADHAGEFDNRIVGIDPGAGIMSTTEEAMEAYDLTDMNLVSGSGATMTAALGSAINNEEPIVVTGWTPHWMFARWDVHYLDDPKDAYGGAEHIDTVVRQGLQEDMPVAACILDNFHWDSESIGEVMLLNQQEGSDPYENARQWVNNHPDVVSEWTSGCSQS